MLVEVVTCNCGFETTILEILNKHVLVGVHPIDEPKETLCPECGRPEVKIVQTWKYICPKCGGNLEEKEIDDGCVESEVKDGTLRFCVPEIMGSNYSTPLHSDALALTPENVEEHKRQFPDVEIDSELRPVFTNVKQHDAYMEKIGVYKPINKSKKRNTIYGIPGTSCHRARNISK